jgi:hypothetical protein
MYFSFSGKYELIVHAAQKASVGTYSGLHREWPPPFAFAAIPFGIAAFLCIINSL